MKYFKRSYWCKRWKKS